MICTFDVNFLTQDPVKSHKETSILAQYVDGSSIVWPNFMWLPATLFEI